MGGRKLAAGPFFTNFLKFNKSRAECFRSGEGEKPGGKVLFPLGTKKRKERKKENQQYGHGFAPFITSSTLCRPSADQRKKEKTKKEISGRTGSMSNGWEEMEKKKKEGRFDSCLVGHFYNSQDTQLGKSSPKEKKKNWDRLGLLRHGEEKGPRTRRISSSIICHFLYGDVSRRRKETRHSNIEELGGKASAPILTHSSTNKKKKRRGKRAAHSGIPPLLQEEEEEKKKKGAKKSGRAFNIFTYQIFRKRKKIPKVASSGIFHPTFHKGKGVCSRHHRSFPVEGKKKKIELDANSSSGADDRKKEKKRGTSRSGSLSSLG